MNLPHLTLLVKEWAMFAKGLSWFEILKIAGFFNLCILPALLTLAYIIK